MGLIRRKRGRSLEFTRKKIKTLMNRHYNVGKKKENGGTASKLAVSEEKI